MAQVFSDLDDYVEFLNTLYNSSSTPPSSGEEDYTVWTSLANIAVNLWENEEGIFWNELFVKLANAATGDKTTDGTTSYTLPSDFRFMAGGLVWIGSGTNKTAYKVIKQKDIQAYENDSQGKWCYILYGSTSTLEFNPNLTMSTGQTISYAYYKYATKLTTGSSTFEMSDPMFAVYVALSELKKEEGNSGELQIASQKMEAMKTKNETPAWLEEFSLLSPSTDDGFGI